MNPSHPKLSLPFALAARPGGAASSGRRRLLRYLAPHRTRLVLALLSLLVSTGFGLVFPQLIVNLLEGIERTRDLRFLDSVVAALAAVFLLQSLFGFVETYLLSVIGEQLVSELRRELYAHLHELSLDFFARFQVGSLLSRLSNDVSQARQVLTTNLGVLVGQTATLLGALALMLHMNVRLTLFMLALAPPMLLLAQVFSKRLERGSARVQEQLADSTAIAEEGLRAAATVKSFGAERLESERYARALKDAVATATRVAWQSAAFTSLMGYLALGSIAAIIWYGGREVIALRLSAAQVTGFLIYGIIIAGSLGQLSALFGQLSTALGAVQRVFEMLDARPTVVDAPAASSLRTCAGRITFENVCFGYGDERGTLEDISLDIQPGEIVALVGPSGAGKSTLFQLIPRFYDVSAGRLAIDGKDVRTLTQESLRAHVGMVPQEATLLAGTIRENILYGRRTATEEEVIAAARAANAHDFISSFARGYDHVVGERGQNLSGGQRQRLAIARAILKDPRILLLDEATSALDSESERLVQEALERLMGQGRTTLIVAHRLSTIRFAHRIAVLDTRRIVELGTHDELIRKGGLYARLHALQWGPSSRAEPPETASRSVEKSLYVPNSKTMLVGTAQG